MAGSRYDAHRRRPSGRLRSAHREVGRSLLVSGHDDLQQVALVHEDIEQVVVLDAGQAEQLAGIPYERMPSTTSWATVCWGRSDTSCIVG